MAILTFLRVLIPLVILIAVLVMFVPRYLRAQKQRAERERINVDATVVSSEQHASAGDGLDTYEASPISTKPKPAGERAPSSPPQAPPDSPQ